MQSSTWYRRFAWGTAFAAVALVVLGGVVRITGSGMGCGEDWPLCHGRLIPPMTFETALEYGHRLSAAAVSLLTVLLLITTRLRHWDQPALRNPVLLAVGLLAVQVLLGQITVKFELPPASVILHLGTAMLFVAVLMIAGLRARAPSATPATGWDGYARWTWAAAGWGFVVVMLGGLVANLDAGPACQGFPLCNGSFWPANRALIQVHWVHRLFAYAFVFVAIGQYVMTRRHRRDATSRQYANVLLGLMAAQVAIAAAMVQQLLPPTLRALHLAAGTLIWMVLVAMAHHARLAPGSARDVRWSEEAQVDTVPTT